MKMKHQLTTLLVAALAAAFSDKVLAADPPATNSHFQIVKSFPVSEANYQEVNRVFPGLDGAIENGARTAFVYAGKKCRNNTYGDSFTQRHCKDTLKGPPHE